ncbi:MAG: hypothetical protein KKC99_13125 [Proteobacteria bacterium]|nr:hypothetical protein [Pseudomonadota bacterium]
MNAQDTPLGCPIGREDYPKERMQHLSNPVIRGPFRWPRQHFSLPLLQLPLAQLHSQVAKRIRNLGGCVAIETTWKMKDWSNSDPAQKWVHCDPLNVQWSETFELRMGYVDQSPICPGLTEEFSTAWWVAKECAYPIVVSAGPNYVCNFLYRFATGDHCSEHK